ncbi:hypothetical protein D3C85_1912740 [compost metagenome]
MLLELLLELPTLFIQSQEDVAERSQLRYLLQLMLMLILPQLQEQAQSVLVEQQQPIRQME